MSRYWSGLIPAAVIAATAALGAQGQNPANTPPADAGAPAGVQRTTPPPSAQTRTDTVTISGCLQNAPMASAAGAGAGVNRGSTTGNAAGNNPSRDGGNTTGSTAGNTTGNSGSATASASGNTTAQAATGTQFVLNGASMTAEGKAAPVPVGTSGTASTSYMLQGDVATLSPHLNHRVEITGTLQSSSASATGAANARTGATASGPTLRVDSVKMLADKCDAGASTTTTPAPEPITPAPAPTTEPRQQ